MGAGPRIAKLVNRDFLTALIGFLTGAVVKAGDHAGAMMCGDGLAQRLAELMTCGEFESFLHMIDDYQSAHARAQVLVAVHFGAVLGEIARIVKLANIMEIRGDAGQEWVCAHGLGSMLGPVSLPSACGDKCRGPRVVGA